MKKQVADTVNLEKRQREKGQEDVGLEMSELFRQAIESLKRMDADPEFSERISKRIS